MDRSCLSVVVSRTARGVAVKFPLHTVSEANAPRSKWRDKNRRVADQRAVVTAVLQVNAKAFLRLPLVVTIVRIAPLEHDGDNLQNTLKAVRDAVAALACPVRRSDGRIDGNDRDQRVTWRYGQERGKQKEYAVRIELHPREDGPESDVELVEDAIAILERVRKAKPSAAGAAEALLAALR